MSILDEEQLKWKFAHHASVNAKNYEHRHKVIMAFLNDFTILDERLPQYVHKPFLTNLLQEWKVEHRSYEHKGVLWQKILQHLHNKEDQKKRTPKKPIVVRPYEEEKPHDDDESSCTTTLHKLETLLNGYLHRSKKTPAHKTAEIIDVGEEEEEDSGETTDSSVIDKDETKRNIVPKKEARTITSPLKTLPPTSQKTHYFHVTFEEQYKELKRRFATEDAQQIVSRLAKIAPEYPATEVFEVLFANRSELRNNVADNIEFVNVLRSHLNDLLRQTVSEFPDVGDSNKFMAQEFVTLFAHFRFTNKQVKQFIKDDDDWISKPLQKQILVKWNERFGVSLKKQAESEDEDDEDDEEDKELGMLLDKIDMGDMTLEEIVSAFQQIQRRLHYAIKNDAILDFAEQTFPDDAAQRKQLVSKLWVRTSNLK